VPQIEIVRATVSPALSRVIERALAKVPADRQASVQQFIDELKASETGTAGRTVPLPSVRTPHLRWKVLASLAAVVVLGVGGVAVARRLDRPPIDPARVAVLPFRVSGDSGLAYLQEGMVDLLTTQLGSVNGVRPVDTRTVLAAWHREVRADAQPPSISDAISIAAKLGSGQLVDGSLVGSGRAGEITISARLVDVEGADRMPEPVSVTGSRDSLFALVDQLTSKLIAEWVQEPARRLEDLTSASLPAVRAYLDGRAAYRLGEFDRAQASFTRALELDTTFALAALGMASTGAWSQQAGQSAALRRGLLTGYALRSRLSRRDQLLFEAYVLPDGGAVHTARDQLVAWQRASEAAPESPEAQYAFGDRLYHSGIQLGIVEAEAQAESAFVRALALDSTFVPPLAHLVEVAARLNDRTRTQRLARLYASEAAKGDNGDYVRWRVAHAVGDRRALDSLHARRGRINQSALNRMIGFGLTDAMPMDHVDAAANELKRRVDAGTFVPENVFPGQTLLAWALNRGRRADAERAYAMLRAADKRPAGSSIVFFSSEQAPLLAALFWDGDSAAAGAAATRIESRWTGEAPRDRGARARYYTDLCVLALWRQATGGTVEPWRLRLRTGAATADSTIVDGADPVVCLTMIDLREAISAGRTESEAHVARLDSILTSGPYVFGSDWGNIVLSRAYVARGDLPSALRVIRRRPYDWDTGPLYLSTYLREEAQLAAASGDAAGARRAYTRFLALRAGADDPYRAQVDSATRAIGRLP
jgi:tetratricopeptide (TPR) repeat protein